jgi:GGDEF domain-containing protein
LSDVIRASVREIDVACRYGGEEFALILPETSRTGAYIVSERIRVDAKEVFDHKPLGSSPPASISMSVSGGIAIYPTDSNSAEGLVRMADKALYRSKHEEERITLHAEEKRRSVTPGSSGPGCRTRATRPRRAGAETEPPQRSAGRKRIADVGTGNRIDIYSSEQRSDFFLGRVVRLEGARRPGPTRGCSLRRRRRRGCPAARDSSEIYGPLRPRGESMT